MLKAQEEADAKELERRRLIEDLITAQIDDANVKRLAELEIQQERQREGFNQTIRRRCGTS